MKPELIITHPGSAHFDEVTAVSLILAVYTGTEFKIERRNPSLTELEDPSIWVVDTGNRHEPEKLNFDHHQSLDCPSGFVLIADYLNLLDKLSILPWWNFKDSVDRIGPVAASRKYNAGDDLVNINPVENWLVDNFSSKPQECIPMLRTYGTSIIESGIALKRQLDYWKSCPRLKIAGLTAIIGENRETYGLEEFHRLEANPPDIAISLDRRSDGWRLYRFEGSPVDFSLLSDDPQIEFAHKTGFMAKTRDRLSIDDLKTLIARAINTKN